MRFSTWANQATELWQRTSPVILNRVIGKLLVAGLRWCRKVGKDVLGMGTLEFVCTSAPNATV